MYSHATAPDLFLHAWRHIMALDRITVSVIQHRLESIVQEMGEAMLRTAYSQILNSSRDFSTAVFDGEGVWPPRPSTCPFTWARCPWPSSRWPNTSRDASAPATCTCSTIRITGAITCPT